MSADLKRPGKAVLRVHSKEYANIFVKYASHSLKTASEMLH